MGIDQLGYLVVQSTDIERWRSFATQVIGAAVTDGPDGSLYVKVDAREQRMVIVKGEEDGLFSSGWETRTKEDFQQLRRKIEDAGVQTRLAEPAACALRRVTEMFSLQDPSGNEVEVYWGPISDFQRFISPVGVTEFITGSMGMGHVVLPAMNFDETQTFWSQTMGFGLSDILNAAMGPDHVASIHFMHCNPRQHSLALAQMPVPSKCVHMMLEVPNIDEVGRALDRVEQAGIPLAATLGRHVNDDMVSFYVWTPGNFALEYGCNGIVKDWEKDYTVFETTVGSHWGHQWQLPPGA